MGFNSGLKGLKAVGRYSSVARSVYRLRYGRDGPGIEYVYEGFPHKFIPALGSHTFVYSGYCVSLW